MFNPNRMCKMPKIVVMVPETLNSVTRPVVLEIARRLM